MPTDPALQPTFGGGNADANAKDSLHLSIGQVTGAQAAVAADRHVHLVAPKSMIVSNRAVPMRNMIGTKAAAPQAAGLAFRQILP
jgi:hypothetical protein